MIEDRPRVMLVGQFMPGSLERSYQAAFESIECEVLPFDLAAAVAGYCRLGELGRRFNKFVPVEAWIKKANRDLVSSVTRFRPHYVVTVGQYPLRAGALAQIRASVRTALIHIWPDTLLNLGNDLAACLPLFDLVASYSESSLEQLQKLGARRVTWIPLAGDPVMHAPVGCTESEQARYRADVTFIGGWRPEREAVLSTLHSFDLKIWGPDWGRRCKGNKFIQEAWQGQPLYEGEFAKAVGASKINLNIIDPLNYPAANMRFFELPTAGGLQVASTCPEMENYFLNGQHVFYYRDVDDLRSKIETLIENASLRAEVAEAGRLCVMTEHTYDARARSILQQLQSGPH